MKIFRVLPFALALVLAFPVFPAHAAAVDYGITVVAVGTVSQEALLNAKKAADETAAYLEENGIDVFRGVPKIIRLYETADMFVEGMYADITFDSQKDRDEFEKQRDDWKGTAGTVTKNFAHINMSVPANADTATLMHVVSHEFTHVIQRETSQNRYGEAAHQWLVEGSAQLVSFAVTERIAGRNGNIEYAMGGIISDLEEAKGTIPFLAKLSGPEEFDSALETLGLEQGYKVVYGVSALASWYLLLQTRKSLKSLFDYMAEYRISPTDREGNFAKVFGIGAPDFYALFDKFITSIKKN